MAISNLPAVFLATFRSSIGTLAITGVSPMWTRGRNVYRTDKKCYALRGLTIGVCR